MDVARALNQARIPYAVVGGFAVALHGAVRGTMSPKEIIQFTEQYQEVIAGKDSPRKLISLRVPENLLNAFKQKSKSRRQTVSNPFDRTLARVYKILSF